MAALANQSAVVHLTKSLSEGLAKQMWEEGTWALEDRVQVKKGRRSRTGWLKRFNSIAKGMVPANHFLWKHAGGRGKDRTLTCVFLLPLDNGDLEVKAWMACARDFEVRSFSKGIIITRHLIERMFLRLATMNDARIAATLRPVIRFLIFNTGHWSKKNLPQSFDLLTREGRFPVEVKKKDDQFVLKTFVYRSSLTEYQRERFVNQKLAEPGVKYLVLDEEGEVVSLDLSDRETPNS